MGNLMCGPWGIGDSVAVAHEMPAKREFCPTTSVVRLGERLLRARLFGYQISARWGMRLGVAHAAASLNGSYCACWLTASSYIIGGQGMWRRGTT
jgi:hypothetical protein